MSSFLDPKRITIIASIVVAVCVAGLIALLTFVKPINPARDNLTKTEVSAAAENLIPDGQLASLMASPASADWWARLNQFAPYLYLRGVDYTALPAQPTTLGWSLSSSKEYLDTAAVGLNTVYMQFNSPEDAEAVRQSIFNSIGDRAGIIAVKNFVVIAPLGAYSDVEYTLDRFTSLSGDQGSTVGDQAIWTINFAEFSAMLSHNDTDTSNMWSDMLKSLGAQPTDANVYWAGTSTDGLSWQGDLSGSNLWSQAAISSVDFQKAASSNQIIYYGGEEITQEQLDQKQKEELAKLVAQQSEVPADGKQPDYSSGTTSMYFVDPGTEDVQYAMLVENDQTAFGNLTQTADTPTTAEGPDAQQANPEKLSATKLDGGTGYTQITVDPNIWLSKIQHPHDNPIHYILFDVATIKVYSNSTKLDIDLHVAPWADTIDETPTAVQPDPSAVPQSELPESAPEAQ